MLTRVFFLRGKVHWRISQQKCMTKGAVKAGKSDEEQTNEKVVAHFELLGDIPDLISEIFDKKNHVKKHR